MLLGHKDGIIPTPHTRQLLPQAVTAQSKLAAYLWSQLDVPTPADTPVLAVQVM
jgi:hypothetical protein